jgi:hypothetical protein
MSCSHSFIVSLPDVNNDIVICRYCGKELNPIELVIRDIYLANTLSDPGELAQLAAELVMSAQNDWEFYPDAIFFPKLQLMADFMRQSAEKQHYLKEPV